MFLHFSWWFVLYLLVTTHITILTVTIYLHRSVAHRSLSVSKPVEHFFRFWCWMTTGQSTQAWAAVHRKHHAHCEKENDPHSPRIYGFWTVLFKGVSLYKKEATNPETLEKYGKFCPNDWLENHVYKKYSTLGLISLAILELAIFGFHGIWIYLIQIAWIPFWAAGVINGLGHFKGYRNFNTQDDSTNLLPWGIIIGGEELHNNHHAYPTSAKLSMKWYEFDMGWAWIKLLSFFKLVKINKVQHLPKKDKSLLSFHDQVLEVFLSHRHLVWKLFRKYTKNNVKLDIKNSRVEHEILKNYSVKKLKTVFYEQMSNLNESENSILSIMLTNDRLKHMHDYKEMLWKMWNDKHISYQQLKDNLSQWCEHASNTKTIDMFVKNLYTLKTA